MPNPWYLNVMSGAERGPIASALRAGLGVIEPIYAAAAAFRNRAYDRPGRARRLPRPVISVGNITAGGTGKTPVVRWLAQRLRAGGRTVAILARGYKAVPGSLGDEQRMLDRMLNRDANGVPVLMFANPDRFAAGEAALRLHPEIDLFLLDDGFQHRRLARDLDLVLVHAAEPFGYGHVLPRGLLREPLGGLRRAGAFIITHADSVSPAVLDELKNELRGCNAHAPTFAAIHAPVCIHTRNKSDAPDEELPLDRLSGVRAFAFCGIASPAAFERELRRRCLGYAGNRWFADHHAYTCADLLAVRTAARSAGADVLVTTEKDWVKLADLPGVTEPGQLPIWRQDVAARFLHDDEQRLLKLVEGTLEGNDETLSRSS